MSTLRTLDKFDLLSKEVQRLKSEINALDRRMEIAHQVSMQALRASSRAASLIDKAERREQTEQGRYDHQCLHGDNYIGPCKVCNPGCQHARCRVDCIHYDFVEGQGVICRLKEARKKPERRKPSVSEGRDCDSCKYSVKKITDYPCGTCKPCSCCGGLSCWEEKEECPLD